LAENDKPKLPFFLSEKEFFQMTGHWHRHRRVLIAGDLNSESLRKTSLELIKLENVKIEPITLMIESGGGNMVPTQQLEDTINMLNSPVDVIVFGDCASMAVDLIQMCRRRMMLPSARLLVHYIRNRQPWICDDPEQLETDIRYFRERLTEDRERRFALYEKRTGLPRPKLAEMFRHGEVHQAYFSAKQAVELRLVDEIVTDFKLFPKKSE
jgi:ATP-dependent protease ClpP protease subunit